MTGARIFTDERNASTARRMIANGMTDVSVAKLFGVERSTVAWFRRRHNITSKRGVGAKERKPAFVAPRVTPADRKILKGAAWKPLPGTEPVSMVDLEHDMCRWPIGVDRPYLFCGSATESGKSYCPTHGEMAAGRGTESERKAHKVKL